MWLMAGRVEEFRKVMRRPPRDMNELRISDLALQYSVLPNGTWQIIGRAGEATLVLRQGMPRNEFLGSALEQLRS
jgi:hypothetical protein